ncbi:hypothetical protein [Cellulomonas hominis]|uniref:hypothetical protein n=1 Tax=Cellulomonas hominis TaxID=156981 RepID=UPI00144454C3|nr:hypothetical protein [Cellulomonas hominis]NKY08926.1 hypothetical protein [Cellulomonas hominis]
MSDDEVNEKPQSCPACGALVLDADLHETWHTVVLPKQIKQVAGEALRASMTGLGI